MTLLLSKINLFGSLDIVEPFGILSLFSLDSDKFSNKQNSLESSLNLELETMKFLMFLKDRNSFGR